MNTSAVGDLETFRNHVVALPFKEGSDGQWVFTKRPTEQQKQKLIKWITSVLSYDDYGYLKPEEELPTEEKIETMYQDLFRSAASSISYKDHIPFSIAILPGWKGKKDREVNFLMGYDQESFRGPPEIGTMEYYAPVSSLNQLNARLNQMKNETDPVKFLHRMLSE